MPKTTCRDNVWRHTEVVVRHQESADDANTDNSDRKADLRLTPAAKRTLQTAAIASRRSVGFVLESALSRAEETLADRRRFGLDAEQWKAFQVALDASPKPLVRLARLLEEPRAFEGGTTG